MKKFLCCICAVVLMGSCGAASRPSDLTSISPSPSTTVQPRLWVAAHDGAHSVSGFVERSGTGMSIRYELEMEGPVLAVTVSKRGQHGYLVGQSGAPLHGESLRSGYLDVPQGPEAVSILFQKPRLFELTVSFKDGAAPLSTRLKRQATGG